jgi:hypothetical protein
MPDKTNSEKTSILTDAMKRAEELKNRVTRDSSEETPIDKKTAYKRAAAGVGVLAAVATAGYFAWKAAAKASKDTETSTDESVED